MSRGTSLLIKPEQVISSIYDAALDEGKWAQVLNNISSMLKAEQGILRVMSEKLDEVQLVHAFNKDPAWNKLYQEYYKTVDPWIKVFLDSDNSFIDCTHHLIPDKEMENMEFYADFVRPQNFHYGIGGLIKVNDHTSCYLALHRDHNRQGFEKPYLDSLRGLVPHMQKALLINEKSRGLNLQNELLRDCLNQLNHPLLLVNKSGAILFINELAEQLIKQQNAISIHNNRIRLQSSDDHKKLQQLIHQATHNEQASVKQGGGMCITEPAHQATLSVLVSPVSAESSNNDTRHDDCALLLINTSKQQLQVSAELLSSLYKLTPAEARLTMLLCQGYTLDEIAQILTLSKNTLRTQLRSSFRKTGVCRQAELINLVNAGPAGVIKY